MNTPLNHRVQVLIVHGSPLMSAGLASALRTRQDLQVLECRSPDDVLQTVSSATTKCVVVADYESGIRVLMAGARSCRVLIVTDNDSEISIRRAVELGVAGYLPMTCAVDSVVGAVRCLHGGGTMIDPAFISRIAISLASPSLTTREMQVLRLMMEGLSNKAIALRLKRSVGTAKSHVKAILSKLDATTRVEAVAVAQRRGLLPREFSSSAFAEIEVTPRTRRPHPTHWPLASSFGLSMPRIEEGT